MASATPTRRRKTSAPRRKSGTTATRRRPAAAAKARPKARARATPRPASRKRTPAARAHHGEARPEAGSRRATWKGTLEIGDQSIAVKLYSAAQDKDLHFRLLHAADREPVEQEMVHAETGEPVPSGEIRRGYVVDGGDLVVLEADELAELEAAPSRAIDVTRFVPRGTLEPGWFERPYDLSADGDEDAVLALARVLSRREVEGIARWTMRGAAQLGALYADGERLVLHKLRFADEIVATASLAVDQAARVDPREARMADQLVESLSGELELDGLVDEHRARVLEWIEAASAGEAPALPTYRAPAQPRSLAEGLRASLAALKEKRVA